MNIYLAKIADTNAVIFIRRLLFQIKYQLRSLKHDITGAEKFVYYMNRVAKENEMKKSFFSSPSGAGVESWITVCDAHRLGQLAFADKGIKSICCTKKEKIHIFNKIGGGTRHCYYRQPCFE